NVDQQVDDDDHAAADDHHALHHGKVARADAFVEQPADTRPGKHGLDHDCDIDHDHQVDPGQGHHWNQCVLEGVLADHQCLGEAFDARQLDVFRNQNVEHR